MVAQVDEHVTVPLGTAPSVVCGEKLHVVVSTTVPCGCSTVIVALVNRRSVIASVHFGFGQSGAPAIGVLGGFVETLNVTLPFLTAEAGIAWLPVVVIGVGFCPAGCVAPEGFVQLDSTSARAETDTSTFALPNPARSPLAFRTSP